MKLPLTLLIVTAALAALSLTTAGASSSGRQAETPDRCQASRAPLLCTTHQLRRKVWKLEKAMGLPVSRTTYSDRRRHASRAYREWVRDLWVGRLEQLEERHKRWSAIPHRQELLALAQCETQTNWRHSNSTYQGALGFAISTWDAYAPASFPDEAYLATPEQQLMVGEILIRTFGGFSSWPACSIRLGLR